MKDTTRRLWELQDRHRDDRLRLFSAVRVAIGGERALYPGSFVDVAASMAFPWVTYVDVDRRAPSFFADEEGVREIVGVGEHRWEFIHADYTDALDLADESFDVLVSLYAGFVSDHGTRYLRVGGHLLVNPSHGDAALASIDERYRLAGVVLSRSGDYRVRTDDLGGYLVPKDGTVPTREALLERGRGIAYTKPAFAYLFERVG